MPITKEAVIAAIQRTASENGGAPLGQRTFERETGIPTASWRGKFWRTWSDALIDAGFAESSKNADYQRSSHCGHSANGL